MSLLGKIRWSVPTEPALLEACLHPEVGTCRKLGGFACISQSEKCEVWGWGFFSAPCLLPPSPRIIASIQRAGGV